MPEILTKVTCIQLKYIYCINSYLYYIFCFSHESFNRKSKSLVFLEKSQMFNIYIVTQIKTPWFK